MIYRIGETRFRVTESLLSGRKPAKFIVDAPGGVWGCQKRSIARRWAKGFGTFGFWRMKGKPHG